MTRDLPSEMRADLKRAKRLEWWTLGWMGSVVVVMWLAMGSSQAMKTAMIEDLLSLIPAIVFLVASHYEAKPATAKFPFGFERVHSLASLIAAVALTSVGAFLLFDSAITLIMQEHPTIAPVSILGHNVWLGWGMIAALIYSVIPPVILGRLKQPIARRLQDEVLDTDAMMQRADWMTGLAGIAGVLGVGLGYWWADAVAAGMISFSILQDGIKSLGVATAELVDGTPRALGKNQIAEDAQALIDALEARYPGGEVRLRETGRYIHAQVSGVAPERTVDLDEIWPGDPDRRWRFVQLSFVPPNGERIQGSKS
jgi:cation diffusion facilitator family transporter